MSFQVTYVNNYYFLQLRFDMQKCELLLVACRGFFPYFFPKISTFGVRDR